MDDGNRAEMDFNLIADCVTTLVMLVVLVLQVLSFRAMKEPGHNMKILVQSESAISRSAVLQLPQVTVSNGLYEAANPRTLPLEVLSLN